MASDSERIEALEIRLLTAELKLPMLTARVEYLEDRLPVYQRRLIDRDPLYQKTMGTLNDFLRSQIDGLKEDAADG